MMKLILGLLLGSSLLPSLGDRDSAMSTFENAAQVTQLSLSSKAGMSRMKAQVASAVKSDSARRSQTHAVKGLYQAATDQFEEDEADEGDYSDRTMEDSFDGAMGDSSEFDHSQDYPGEDDDPQVDPQEDESNVGSHEEAPASAGGQDEADAAQAMNATIEEMAYSGIKELGKEIEQRIQRMDAGVWKDLEETSGEVLTHAAAYNTQKQGLHNSIKYFQGDLVSFRKHLAEEQERRASEMRKKLDEDSG
mmetsp:Transcript_25080/g.45627  ORF Transcript_25080/g.45627 Transcript_25080/m.45627 type:complete len:249 (+) Transcript_25080:152-898(+)